MSDYTREAEMALDMVRLRRELEAMKAERDVLVNRVDFLNQQNSVQQEQNDALAAHVERMRDVWQRLHLRSPVHVEVLKAYSHVMRDAPTTSLARLKGTARAEAMEWSAEKAAPSVAPWLNALAEDYRRQAGNE